MQKSSSAVAGSINAKTDDSASDGESVEKGNSADATNVNPIREHRPRSFHARPYQIGKEINPLSCTGKLWISLVSDGFSIFDWISLTAGTIKSGLDFQLTSAVSASAAEFASKSILGKDVNLLCSGNLWKS